uniref:Uncharacterized protein n=1 Tax=Arundo donax TaxID=35708 RepID=A0A0A9AH61_ARUDO
MKLEKKVNDVCLEMFYCCKTIRLSLLWIVRTFCRYDLFLVDSSCIPHEP